MEKRIFKQDMEAKEQMINLQADRNDRSAQIAAQGESQRQQQKMQGDAMLSSATAQNDLVKELVKKDDNVSKQVARRMGLMPNAMTPNEMPETAPNAL
jgi:hypothetical protein